MQRDEELGRQRIERISGVELGDVVLEDVQEVREDEPRIEMSPGADVMSVRGYMSCGHLEPPEPPEPPRPPPCGGRGRSRRRA